MNQKYLEKNIVSLDTDLVFELFAKRCSGSR